METPCLRITLQLDLKTRLPDENIQQTSEGAFSCPRPFICTDSRANRQILIDAHRHGDSAVDFSATQCYCIAVLNIIDNQRRRVQSG